MAGDNGIVKESVHVPNDWYRSEFQRIFSKDKTEPKEEEAPKEAHPCMVEHEEVEKYREEWELYKEAHNGFEHYLIYELKRSQAKYKKLEEAFDTKTRVHDKLNADYVALRDGEKI